MEEPPLRKTASDALQVGTVGLCNDPPRLRTRVLPKRIIASCKLRRLLCRWWCSSRLLAQSRDSCLAASADLEFADRRIFASGQSLIHFNQCDTGRCAASPNNYGVTAGRQRRENCRLAIIGRSDPPRIREPFRAAALLGHQTQAPALHSRWAGGEHAARHNKNRRPQSRRVPAQSASRRSGKPQTTFRSTQEGC